MKKQSNNLFETISIELNQSNSNSANETLATSICSTNSRVFTAADLWNIQRKGISSLQRRNAL